MTIKKPTQAMTQAGYKDAITDRAIVPRITSPSKRQNLANILAEHPGNSVDAQCNRLLAALRLHPITTFEAMRYLDCYDPRTRILKLSEAGHHIETVWVKSLTESGETHRIGRYVLMPWVQAMGAVAHE